MKLDEMINKYGPFIACLSYDVYDDDRIPMSVEDAAYTLQQWQEEGSIEPPPGFTPEIFSLLWNRIICH